VEVVVLTSDRGLCGGFNANINRRADRFLAESEWKERIHAVASSAEAASEPSTNNDPTQDLGLAVVGRKGREYFRRRGRRIRHEYPGVTGDVALERAQQIAKAVIEDYEREELDAVYLV